MPFEVTEPTIELHEEGRFFAGDLADAFLEDGQFGQQLKWIIELDDDGTYTDDKGVDRKRQVWTWCSAKLTTHERNTFRKYAKGLTGKEPQPGELFDERHYTRAFYEGNPSADPEELTGLKQPWRVRVMFEHGKKPDGTPKEKVSLLLSEERMK